jgi:hypothetical protein
VTRNIEVFELSDFRRWIADCRFIVADGKPQHDSLIKSTHRRGKRIRFERLKIVVALPFSGS